MAAACGSSYALPGIRRLARVTIRERSPVAIGLEIEKRIPAALRPAMGDWSARLSELFSHKLLGLTLYGSVLEDGPHAVQAAAQTVMVLERIELPVLRHLAQHASMFGRRGLAAPLVMTPAYIAASMDSFPLELMEIQQRHVTVAGSDHFKDLAITPEHMRLECEREFKRIGMRIRQGILASADRDAFIDDLVADIGLHVLRIMRGVLWIKGAREYQPPEQVVAQCANRVNRPLTGIREAMRASGGHGWSELEAIYEDVGALAGLMNDEK
jgi:hypothetical protein